MNARPRSCPAIWSILLVLLIVFTALKRKYNPKLEGSSFFGGNEYYWGVVAGLVRYLCLMLVALALLNAPYYTAADIAGQTSLQQPLVWRRPEEL